jgi:hypothetical protein
MWSSRNRSTALVMSLIARRAINLRRNDVRRTRVGASQIGFQHRLERFALADLREKGILHVTAGQGNIARAKQQAGTLFRNILSEGIRKGIGSQQSAAIGQ